MTMSCDMKQKISVPTESKLGNYFSNRSHAIKEDLDSFKAFLVLLKYQYRDRVEIPRTVIKLLHMYHPQDGYEAYMKLIKVICVLLEELDHDILKYLLSIIPPPNLTGSKDEKSMKEEIQEIAGFTLLSTPAFHTWVLPVLNNMPSALQQDVVNDIKPTDMLKSQNFQTDSEPTKISETLQIKESCDTHLNSDNDSVIAEPKLEDYDLYEIIGDLSKTILNQLSAKQESKLSTFKNVKDMADLELLMTPSALKMSEVGNLPDGKEKEGQKFQTMETKKSLSVCDLNVDPVLENSVKSFIARACGMFPSTVSDDIEGKKQVVKKPVSKTRHRKKKESDSKMKDIETVPKKRKSLLDELTCPLKKSLLSNLITPLDPVESIGEINKKQLKSHRGVNYENESLFPDKEHTELNSEIKSESKILEIVDKKKKKKISNKKNSKRSKYDVSKVIYNEECILNDSSNILKEKESMTAIATIPDVLSYVSNLIPADEEEKELPLEIKMDELSAITQNVEIVDSEEKLLTVPVIKSEVQSNCENNKSEEHVLKPSSCDMKQEHDSDPIHIDFPFKNLDLEWSRENMKLFGINMLTESCNTCEIDSNVQLTDVNEENKSGSASQMSEASSNPKEQSFPICKSHTSTEYLSYLHDLAVAKCTEQRRKSPINKDSVQQQPKKHKSPCKVRDTSMSHTMPCYQYGKNSGSSNLKQQVGCEEPTTTTQLSCSQGITQSTERKRTWTGYSAGVFDQHHPLNLCNDSTALKHYDYMRSTQLGSSISGISSSNNTNMIGNMSIPYNANSSYVAVSAYQTLPNNQNWMMKQSGSNRQVQHPSWGRFPTYEQYPIFREVAQQRDRLAQRAAFLQQASTSVNSYLDPAHTLMMNGLWGSVGSVRHGLYNRTTDGLLPRLPHPMFPINASIQQHQQLHTMNPSLFPNYIRPGATVITTIPPPQTKRRKLEEIVGRLKEAEKIA